MRVVVAQPYVPEYRVPLFDELARQLRNSGGSLTVATGKPARGQEYRRDAATGRWHVELPACSLRTPAGEFKYRKGLARLVQRADLCVLELDAGNVNAWALLRASKRPVVLWGHGKAFVTSGNALQERARARMARQAAHVMTYSEEGRLHLVNLGVPLESITAVGNSTDTATLRRALSRRRRLSLSHSEVFPGIDLTGRTVALYVGGLDGDKRVPFLLAAADSARAVDPTFLLLVAGSGKEQGLVQEAAKSSHVAWTPLVNRVGLADLGAVSTAIWMPGRVGLVAVDAIAMGIPVLTTPYRFHAPEFGFLKPEHESFVLPDEPEAFGRAALAFGQATMLGRDSHDVPSISRVADKMMGIFQRSAMTQNYLNAETRK